MVTEKLLDEVGALLSECREDWVLFAEEVLGVYLDEEQKAILRSVQHNKMTSVASGTARGKDFVSAVAALCFLYNTPGFEGDKLIENTKVALTAPTDRQILNIMMPEVARLHRRMLSRGFGFMAGRLSAYAIKTEYEEWFLTGFKADEHNHEAWSGFHAVNTMFIVTEASGISESIYNAIEGNLQGNSRILIVFNPNTPTGYAANSQKSPRWHKFRLDSLNAPNVLQKRQIIPGQVDYDWVKDKVDTWCQQIAESDFLEAEGDFVWEGKFYRPNDLFRVKVRGMFPKVSSDVLVPFEWIEAAQKRWKEFKTKGMPISGALRLGSDIAGMGRDSSSFCYRYDNYVDRFESIQSGGVANHMQVAGKILTDLKKNNNPTRQAQAFLDTIGEGAGVYSRLEEEVTTSNVLDVKAFKGCIHSVKFSEAAEWKGKILKDQTGQYEFLNMRAYLYWCIRDWLNPAHKTGGMLPPDDELTQELTETKWEFMSNGKIKIEPKEDIKERLTPRRSPDKSDALANTFYPAPDIDVSQQAQKKSWYSHIK